MVLVEQRMESLGIPPQFLSAVTGFNQVLTGLGFPRWTLVKWQLPPLVTFWLLIVLMLSGLRWFALFEILFVVYKFCEEYGISNWLNGCK